MRKKIAKRMQIIKGWAFDGKPHPWEMEPHRAHKFNLNCGCKMCHYYKHVGNSKQKLTAKDKRMIDKAEVQKCEESVQSVMEKGS